MGKWYTHFSASVSGAFSRWGASNTGEFFPSDEMVGEGAAVGDRMDHRGSLLWGRYEIDCCRFVARRFGGSDAVENGETVSGFEEVLSNESKFEVARCNGRGGNECRLVLGAVIFSKPSAEDTPAMMNAEYRRKAKRGRDLPAGCRYR